MKARNGSGDLPGPIRYAAALILLAGCGGGEPAARTTEPAEKQPERQVYVTWPNWEADRAASIWLMKRHVNPEAEFRFIQKGDPIGDMIPFDIPQAQFLRKHNLACYQVILQEHGLTDPVLVEIGKLVWDIEINFWADKKFEGSLAFKKRLDTVFAQELAPAETMAACLTELDAIADELRRKSPKLQ